MIVFLLFAMLAGQMALPILLRGLVWIIHKLSPRDSELYVTVGYSMLLIEQEPTYRASCFSQAFSWNIRDASTFICSRHIRLGS